MPWHRWSGVMAVAIATTVIAAACSGGSDSPPASEAAAPAPLAATAEQASPPPAAFDAQARSTLVSGDADFSYAALIWQGYWLSRDQFGPFVMASGLGIPFEPPMDMLQGAMGMVAQNADDPVMVPQNMAPLQAIYASASPALTQNPQDFAPLDFQAFRLDPATFDKTIRVGSMAQTMIKESQWARNFASAHFGEPGGDFGAQQRFMGVMTSLLAQMQGRYALETLVGEDGLYVDSDGTLDAEANWALLLAFADLAGITADGSHYADAQAHGMWADAAQRLATALTERTPASVEETATAIRALAYHAWTTSDADSRSAALDRLGALAAQVPAAPGASPVERAAQLVVWMHTDVTLDTASYAAAVQEVVRAMRDDFDWSAGVFTTQSVYSVDDVAWILGGLNGVVQEGDEAARVLAGPMLVAFYESTLDLSGLQLSAPPGKDGAMAGAWEKTLPSVLYYHGANTPPPPMAGGAHGLLPVPASEITWDGNAWRVSDDTFTTEGAMRLANELNWFHTGLGSVHFPAVLG